MEDQYFLIHDNINEIILIIRSIRIVFNISFTHKNTSRYFYRIDKVKEKVRSNNQSFELSKYIIDNELICGENIKYKTYLLRNLSSMDYLNSLKIHLTNVRSFKSIDLRHFLHLTRLCSMRDYYDDIRQEIILFNETCIKYLTNVLANVDILSHPRYHNLEKWKLTLTGTDKDYFKNFICTRLTSLKLNSHHTCNINFHENYFENLLELNVGFFRINYDNFHRLTFLKIYSMECDIDLNKMSGLKTLVLRQCHVYSETIRIKNSGNLNYLFLNGMQYLNIGEIHPLIDYNRRNWVYIKDNLTNLTRLKITVPGDIELNLRDPSKLSHLKQIEYNNVKFTNIYDFANSVIFNRVWIVHGEIDKKAWKDKLHTQHLINNKAFKNLDVLSCLYKVTFANEKETYNCTKFRIRQRVQINKMNIEDCKERYLKYIES